jgi:predicted nuclease of predicted toxin-antitoxin system
MSLRVLLDENFPLSARTFLETQGCSVLDIRGTPREGCDDKTLFAWAQENHAITLTTDKDFFHTIPLRSSQHHGVVVIALKKPNSMAILHRLKSVWDQLENTGFKDCAFLLTDTRIYSRRR